MIIVGSDNRFLYRKFGDRLFDLDPKVHTPVADVAGNLESWNDNSAVDADLDSTDSGLGVEASFNFEGDLTNSVDVLNAIKKTFDWHTGETRDDTFLYLARNKVISVPTFKFDTINQEVSITFTTYGGAKFGLEDNWLFQAARNADTGVIFGAQVTDASGNVKFVSGSQPGAPATTDDLQVAAIAGDATKAIIWTFTKNATTGSMKIYKDGFEVASSLTNTLDMGGIERFIIGGSFNSTYWQGRIGLFRLDNTELTPEVAFHLAEPSIATQDWPQVDFSTMTTTTLSGGLETGTVTVLGTSIGMKLDGEVRRAINLGVSNFNVGHNTYLEFDFESTLEGSQHAIAILDSDGSTDWSKAFQLFGTNIAQGNQTYNDYALVDGVKHYKIQIGKELGILLLNHGIIGLINVGSGNSSFYNVRLIEEVTENPLNTYIDFSTAPTGGGWLPTELPTLQLWLDASDSDTIIHAAGAVSQWNDKSGNSNHAVEPVAADQPTTGIQSINGLNVINFNQDHFDLTSSITNARAAVLMGKSFAGGGDGLNQVSCIFGEIAVGQDHTFIMTNAANPYDVSVDGSVGNTGKASYDGLTPAAGTNITVAGAPMDYLEKRNPHQWYFEWDLAQTIEYIARLDSGATTQYFLVGDIGEVILLSSVPTTADRQKLEGYLAWKWGTVAKLPAGHPYKTDGSLFEGGGGYSVVSPNEIILNGGVDLAINISHNVNVNTLLQLRLQGVNEDDRLLVAVQNSPTGYEANDHTFKLWGTEVTTPDVNIDYNDYVGNDIPKFYNIPLGTYISGLQTIFKILMGDTLTTAGVNMYDVKLVEPPIIPSDLDSSAIVVYNMNESAGGKVNDDSSYGSDGAIIKGNYSNPYAGTHINFNKLLHSTYTGRGTYPEYLTNLVRAVTFDESQNGLFFEKINNDPIYGLGTPYPSRVVSPSGHAIQLVGTHWLAWNYTVPLTNVTISLWFKTTSAGTMTIFATGNGQTIAGSDRYIELVAGNIRAFINGETITSTGLTLNDDQWHHVVYSYSSSIPGQVLVVDKVLVASGAQTTSTGADHDFVGIGARDAGTNDFIGTIDQLRIYNAYIGTDAIVDIYDVYGTLSFDNLGRRVTVYKNMWYLFGLESSYTLTPNTILEFDFESTQEAEEHSIGVIFDLNDTLKRFKIFGTQIGQDAIFDYDDYILADGVKHYRIPIGQYYTGLSNNLIIVNDSDALPDNGNSAFSNIQLYEDSEEYAVLEVASQGIKLHGDEILEVASHPNMNGLDHGIVFAIKTTCNNATILQYGDLGVNGYRIFINNDGHIVIRYVVAGTDYDTIISQSIDDDVLHRVILHLENSTKTLTYQIDNLIFGSTVLPAVYAAEPTGPFYMGGHDGSYSTGGYEYNIPDTFDGYLDFVKVNTNNVKLLQAFAMGKRVDVLPNENGISFRGGLSPTIFREGNVPIDSYGTIIMAVKMPPSLTSKITAVSGLGISPKINLRASAGDVLGFEMEGVSEYPSTYTVSANEVLVLAVTSIIAENQVYITKNLGGRETIPTAGDYKLPTEVLGELGPFDLIRIVGYSSPLSETEERYLIRQIMKHPSVGLL